MATSPIVMIDASTFQRQIAELAETIAQKAKREGRQHLAGPNGFHEDIFISMASEEYLQFPLLGAQ